MRVSLPAIAAARSWVVGRREEGSGGSRDWTLGWLGLDSVWNWSNGADVDVADDVYVVEEERVRPFVWSRGGLGISRRTKRLFESRRRCPGKTSFGDFDCA